MSRLVAVFSIAIVALSAISAAHGQLDEVRKVPARQEDAKKDDAKKKEKPKPPFETFRVFTEPNEKSFVDPKQKDSGRVVQAIKPGHWSGILVQTMANNFDFTGELVSMPLDSQQNPIPLDSSTFCLVTERPVALPKGQRKTLESLFFAARSGHMSTQISNRLRTSQHVDESLAFGDSLSHMPSYQYFMIVLAREPNRYGFLKGLESVRPTSAAMPINPEDAAYYRLVAPATDHALALPSEPLCWTAIAAVVWDDVLPASLSIDQQRSLVDWLEWGGLLIVSGPQTLDSLRGTILEPYLPATAAAAKPLDPAAVEQLSTYWTVPDDRGQRVELRPAAPWSGIELTTQPAADFVNGTGRLVVERRVGRGRIVATAFRLSEPELWRWPSFDSFFNACILRRPSRRFDPMRQHFEFVTGGDRLDPALVTNVRFLTRDARDPDDRSSPSDRYFPADAIGRGNRPGGLGVQLDEADIHKTQSGVAAWNDFSWFSSSARDVLRSAAGISVPKRSFVFWMLGIYLVVIVPVNWFVFRLLGRVEWAWFAVPVLALAWGLAVVWLAQLDIGFARAQTEVAVLELQNGYPRGHLTRYTALYSSLSTSYDVQFDGRSALAQPFSADVQLLRDQGVSTVALRDGKGRELSEFPVSSNATGMVHSEQMVDAGVGLAWHATDDGSFALANNTDWQLSGAVILRRGDDEDDDNQNGWAWLGDVAPGAKVGVSFVAYDSSALVRARDQAPLTLANPVGGVLSMRRLLDCAETMAALEPGEVRLVAWRDEGIEGMRIDPAAPQARRATMVVAHLAFAAWEPPRPDASLRPSPAPDEPLSPDPQVPDSQALPPPAAQP
jgi:hypothetical protein